MRVAYDNIIIHSKIILVNSNQTYAWTTNSPTNKLRRFARKTEEVNYNMSSFSVPEELFQLDSKDRQPFKQGVLKQDDGRENYRQQENSRYQQSQDPGS